MKIRNVLFVVLTIGLALIPMLKNLGKQDEFDATRDLFI
jgi:hypothetical protein